MGRNAIVGGEPEAGKSVAMSSFLAAACLDPAADIFAIDAKRVELSLWRHRLSAFVTTSIDDAIALVETLISDMDDRYEKLESDGLRNVTPDMGWRTKILAIDELRFFTAYPEKRSRDKFNLLLIDLVARCRAVGMAVLAGTQRPSSDVVPTSLRDIMGLRWAMRCATRDASDTILGAGWATEGYSAANIDAADRGIGLLLAEGGVPMRLKSAWLSDQEIARIVARGIECKGGAMT
ncbi:hypothetical protein LG943_00715 [Streptomonospora sp. S1-112]|uniref:FtsK domain-containing protein n=2 Tax=Streptomonospora mangrovi TaxID=2883123 RepID=A0A9X3NLU6_9ACTN|nr:hypothetical protein [Streptomonospora mangrovi]